MPWDLQRSLPFGDPSPLEVIDRHLRAVLGAPPPRLRLDPLSQLVLSSLGSRTHGEVAVAAFTALQGRFRDWAALSDAPAASVLLLIHEVTFAEDKAARLPSALRSIQHRRGSLDLGFLGTWPVEAACSWLERLPGVGPKVSAAVVNFSTLRLRALVVDSHHRRVAVRLGLLPPGADFTTAHRRLLRAAPDAWGAARLDDHHQLMKRHGQTVCRHTRPACGRCALRDLCPASR